MEYLFAGAKAAVQFTIEQRRQEAVYSIMAVREAYAVRVTMPGCAPALVSSFPTREAAEQWAIAHRAAVTGNPSLRRLPKHRARQART
jgi:hypothetical protein